MYHPGRMQDEVVGIKRHHDTLLRSGKSELIEVREPTAVGCLSSQHVNAMMLESATRGGWEVLIHEVSNRFSQ